MDPLPALSGVPEGSVMPEEATIYSSCSGNFNWGDPPWGTSLRVTTCTVMGWLPRARLCWPWAEGPWLSSGASSDVILRCFFLGPLTSWAARPGGGACTVPEA